MSTKLALSIRDQLSEAEDPIISRLDPPEMRFPWPGQNKQVWPQADISGLLASAEAFIVEIDDHADPARSLVKYWPLLHSMAHGEFDHQPIAFVEVSKRDSTFGRGFQALARFVGSRFQSSYPRHFRFHYVDLGAKEVAAIADEVLLFFREQGRRAA